MGKESWLAWVDVLVGIATAAHLAAEAWKHWNEAEAARMRRRLDEALSKQQGGS
jgi:hypothetical protein